MTIQKQPTADTRRLTEEIKNALDELRVSLPDDVVLEPTYKQREFIEQLHEGQRSFDVQVRLAEPYRNDLEIFHRLPRELPDGRVIPIRDVAKLYHGGGPNTINREDGRRRIVVRVNTMGRARVAR